MAKALRVGIVPTYPESPLLSFRGAGECNMRKERKIRAGLLRRKSGTLVLETTEPRSLHLQSPHTPRKDSPSTMVRVTLRFDPSDENFLPPRLGYLVTTLKIWTFFGSCARQQFPTKRIALDDTSQGMHLRHRALSRRCMSSVKWMKQCRRGLHTSLSSGSSQPEQDLILEPSQAYEGNSFYVARIWAPISLPLDESFVPSFHSCLLSRVYSLRMSLSVNDGGIVGGSVDLNVPIQVTSEGSVVSRLATGIDGYRGVEHSTDTLWHPRV